MDTPACLVAVLMVIGFAHLSGADVKEYDLSTPQKAWSAVIQAAQSGEVNEVKKVTTERGFASLTESIADKDLTARLSQRAKYWQKSEVRWKEQNDQRARASEGPPIKEGSLIFVRTEHGWKLDFWGKGA
jgi:hypothetical protein